MDKSAYRRAGESMISYCGFALRGALLAGRFTLNTRSEKINNNMTVIPVVKLLNERNEAAVQNEIRSIFA
jgi:hypothetical protein